MKIYQCKYCGFTGSRKSVRKCVMKHIKTDKYPYRLNLKESRKNSIITKGVIECK